jgi:BirA family biotin operon repressor/biotin-[acetyl-CoA-carboxylase] ligase
MSLAKLKAALRDVTLGGLRYFPETGSTNDDALAWAASGAPDFSLVVADTQKRGRGRDGRKWVTPSGTSLAFSLVLRPTVVERELVGRFSGLGALALVAALKRRGITAQVKWPNDVLVGRKKVAGVLVEVVWMGVDVDSLVLGIGVNVAEGSLPAEVQLNFPATYVDAEAGVQVDRYALLKDTLVELQSLRGTLSGSKFLDLWQRELAFKGEKVHLWQGQEQPFEAELLGLELDGSLRVRLVSGEVRSIHFGEVHLRPGSS